MLLLKTTSTTPLTEPNVEAGFVSWLEIEIQSTREDTAVAAGELHVAVIHLGEVMNRSASVYDVLDADSADLEALYGVFFEGSALKPEHDSGTGSDLLYFARVDVASGWHQRGLDEAAVKRVIETWGSGCTVAVMPVTDEGEAVQWGRLGFVPVRDPRPGVIGYSALDLSLKHPRVREVEDDVYRFVVDVEPN
jgi:hypothetical protein